jgi:hypothetical protein
MRYLVILLIFLSISLTVSLNFSKVVNAEVKGVLVFIKTKTPTKSKTSTKTSTPSRTLVPSVTKTPTVTSSKTATKTASQTVTRTDTATSTLTSTPSLTHTLISSDTPTSIETPTQTSTETPEVVLPHQVTVFKNINLSPGEKISSQFFDVKKYSIVSIFLKASNQFGVSHWGMTNANCYFAPEGYSSSDRYAGEYPRVTSDHEEPNQMTTSQIIGPYLVCDVFNTVGGSSDVTLILFFKPKK